MFPVIIYFSDMRTGLDNGNVDHMLNVTANFDLGKQYNQIRDFLFKTRCLFDSFYLVSLIQVINLLSFIISELLVSHYLDSL